MRADRRCCIGVVEPETDGLFLGDFRRNVSRLSFIRRRIRQAAWRMATHASCHSHHLGYERTTISLFTYGGARAFAFWPKIAACCVLRVRYVACPAAVPAPGWCLQFSLHVKGSERQAASFTKGTTTTHKRGGPHAERRGVIEQQLSS